MDSYNTIEQTAKVQMAFESYYRCRHVTDEHACLRQGTKHGKQ